MKSNIIFFTSSAKFSGAFINNTTDTFIIRFPLMRKHLLAFFYKRKKRNRYCKSHNYRGLFFRTEYLSTSNYEIK